MRCLVYLAFVWTLGLAASARAQSILHTYTEPEAGARAGLSVAFWDDLNLDGYSEWVIGVPSGDGVGVDSGRVRVHSGSDHSLLLTLQGPQVNARFGRDVENVGDLNSDGVDEIAIGAPGAGRVYVYSGASSALLWSAQDNSTEGFGFSVSAAGDVNADGQIDIVVGSYPLFAGFGPNAVTALSGSDGSQLFHTVTQPGHSVCGAGDVNGDGFDDILCGSGPGMYSARVLIGPSGALLYNLPIPAGSSSYFGYSLTTIGDYTGDGVRELAVGDPTEDLIAGAPGVVSFYSGVNGSLLWSVYSPGICEWGMDLANAGDIDGDGFDDVIMGDAYGAMVYVFSPARQVELFSVQQPALANFGAAVAGNKDLDGDGWSEMIGGAGDVLFGSPGNPSGAVLFTYGCPPSAVFNYCAAVTNSTGLRASMHWQNSTSITNNDFRLSAQNCPPNVPGLFFYGTQPDELTVGDGHLCVSGSTYRLPVVFTGSLGTPSHVVDFTNPRSPAGQISAGETWFFSFWYRDPSGGPAGFNFADGLRVVFCP